MQCPTLMVLYSFLQNQKRGISYVCAQLIGWYRVVDVAGQPERVCAHRSRVGLTRVHGAEKRRAYGNSILISTFR